MECLVQLGLLSEFGGARISTLICQPQVMTLKLVSCAKNVLPFTPLELWLERSQLSEVICHSYQLLFVESSSFLHKIPQAEVTSLRLWSHVIGWAGPPENPAWANPSSLCSFQRTCVLSP